MTKALAFQCLRCSMTAACANRPLSGIRGTARPRIERAAAELIHVAYFSYVASHRIVRTSCTSRPVGGGRSRVQDVRMSFCSRKDADAVPHASSHAFIRHLDRLVGMCNCDSRRNECQHEMDGGEMNGDPNREGSRTDIAGGTPASRDKVCQVRRRIVAPAEWGKACPTPAFSNLLGSQTPLRGPPSLSLPSPPIPLTVVIRSRVGAHIACEERRHHSSLREVLDCS